MPRTLCLAGLLFACIACSPPRQAPPQPGSVAGSRAGAPADAGAGGSLSPNCCPPSERPSCCMAYGGFTMQPGLCFYACDGMPAPSEAWTRGVDSHGCPIWVEPETWTECCGCLDTRN